MIVMTRAVNERVAEDAEFAKFILSCIRRFTCENDWGNQSIHDKMMNDQYPESALGSYKNSKGEVIWIKRDLVSELSKKTLVTILYPSEW